MDSRRFDDLVRALPITARRDVLAGLAGGLLAALPLEFGGETEAKKRKKKKKLQFNDFDCVDIGKACRGNDDNCCSGVCDGKKPKKGEKDKSRCVAHDASTCLSGQNITDCGGPANVACQTTAGENGQCATTTGKAPYCFDSGDCFACKKDADCEAVCGIGAACIVCTDCIATAGTACVGTGNCLLML